MLLSCCWVLNNSVVELLLSCCWVGVGFSAPLLLSCCWVVVGLVLGGWIVVVVVVSGNAPRVFLSLFHIIVRSHFGSITCRLVLPPSAMSEYTLAVHVGDVKWNEEWTFENPPNDLVPLLKYYDWTEYGWKCKECDQTATRGHTGGNKHTNMVWRVHQTQGALRAGYTAATGGGGEGSWAAAAARVGGGAERAAESSGCGSGGAAVGQQLDRIEAAIAKLGTELEKVREQLARLELSTVPYQ